MIFSLKKIGKLGLIEALLIGLDVSNLDVGHLQMICLENNLIEALINLAMKYQEDFLTPISRIWAIAIEGKRK